MGFDIKKLIEKIRDAKEKTLLEADKLKKIDEILNEAKKELDEEELKQLLQRGKHPREWSDEHLINFYGASWEECIARAERGGATDPSAFCGAIRAEKRRRGLG